MCIEKGFHCALGHAHPNMISPIIIEECEEAQKSRTRCDPPDWQSTYQEILCHTCQKEHPEMLGNPRAAAAAVANWWFEVDWIRRFGTPEDWVLKYSQCRSRQHQEIMDHFAITDIMLGIPKPEAGGQFLRRIPGQSQFGGPDVFVGLGPIHKSPRKPKHRKEARHSGRSANTSTRQRLSHEFTRD